MLTPLVWLVGPSLLASWLVSREVCQWNISSQQESVHTCDPPDVEEATAFPSQEDDAIREWRQELPQQTRTCNQSDSHQPWSPSEFDARKDESLDFGGSEENDQNERLGTRVRCASGRLGLVSVVLRQFQETRQFNDTLLADVHFWNYQSREVLVCSLIDEATRFHVTQVLSPQSARDLYEAIMTAQMK